MKLWSMYSNLISLILFGLSKSNHCDETFNEVGRVRSPGFQDDGNGQYENYLNCRWTLLAPEGHNVKLIFENFTMDPECTMDWVEIHDGSTTDYKSLGKYCGYSLPPQFISSQTSMLVVMKTNYEYGWNGIKFSWIFQVQPEACGTTAYTEPGSDSSPGYLANLSGIYKENLDCFWVITAPLEKRVRLQFTSFTIEYQDNCQYDWVDVHNGNSSDATSLGRYCGLSVPPIFVSEGTSLLISMMTDHNVSLSGIHFQWEFEDRPDSCNTLQYTMADSTTSPGYVDNGSGEYVENLDCFWIITAPAEKRVELRFDSFNMEMKNRIHDCYDWIEIYDGSSIASTSIVRRCGSTLMDTFVSRGTSLLVRMKTDGKIGKNGVNFTWNFTDPCREEFNAPGSASSPGYEENNLGKYPSNLDCMWIISAPKGKLIQLKFNSIDLKQHLHGSCNDVVSIHDGNTTASPSLGQSCPIVWPLSSTKYDSSGTTLLVQMTTNGIHSGNGIKFSWIIIEPCGGIFTEAGSTSSPKFWDDGSGVYDNNLDCQWIITAPDGKTVELKFESFDVSEYDGCQSDWVDICDGNSTTSTSFGRYCGSTLPETFNSSGTIILVRLWTNTYNGKNGIKFSWIFVGQTTVVSTLTTNRARHTTTPLVTTEFKESTYVTTDTKTDTFKTSNTQFQSTFDRNTYIEGTTTRAKQTSHQTALNTFDSTDAVPHTAPNKVDDISSTMQRNSGKQFRTDILSYTVTSSNNQNSDHIIYMNGSDKISTESVNATHNTYDSTIVNRTTMYVQDLTDTKEEFIHFTKHFVEPVMLVVPGGTPCGDIPQVDNALVNYFETFDGIFATYTCLFAHKFPDRTDSVRIHCKIATRLWSHNPQNCGVVTCRVLEPTHGELDTNETAYNTVVTYTCDVGYAFPDGTRQRTAECLLTGQWSTELPICRITECKSQQIPPNVIGKFPIPSVYGTRVTLRCLKEFETMDNGRRKNTLLCGPHGNWIGASIACADYTCPIVRLQHVKTERIYNEYGALLAYTCKEGYRFPDGQTQKTMACNDDIQDCIDRTCPPVPEIQNTIASTTNAGVHTVVIYYTREGYVFGDGNRSQESVCGEDLQWSAAKLPKAISCGQPQSTVLNAEIIGDSYNYGDKVVYRCKKGFTFINGDMEHGASCMSNGIWGYDGLQQVCYRVNCSTPHRMRNARVTYTSIQYGANATYTCNQGYHFKNTRFTESMSVCLNNKTWSQVPENCTEIECPPVPTWLNIISNSTDTKPNAIVNVTCQDGDVFADSIHTFIVVRCFQGGKWKPSIPQCQDVKSLKLSENEEITEADNSAVFGIVFIAVLGTVFVLIAIVDIILLVQQRMKMKFRYV